MNMNDSGRITSQLYCLKMPSQTHLHLNPIVIISTGLIKFSHHEKKPPPILPQLAILILH